jgi:hypothetical protein
MGLTVEAAERAIYRVWLAWDGDKSNTATPRLFYNWLEANRLDLLTFRCSGSKYQRVQGWINRWPK